MSVLSIPEDLRARVDSDTCARCRKPILAGHRIFPAYVVLRTGANPMNLQDRGVSLTGEFEMVHADCTNPYLRGGLISG